MDGGIRVFTWKIVRVLYGVPVKCLTIAYTELSFLCYHGGTVHRGHVGNKEIGMAIHGRLGLAICVLIIYLPLPLVYF